MSSSYVRYTSVTLGAPVTITGASPSLSIIGTSSTDFTALGLYASTTTGTIREKFFNSDQTRFFQLTAVFDPSSTPAGLAEHITIGSDSVATLTITRAGQVAVTATGNASAPDWTWSTDLDTGIYHSSDNVIGIAAGGTAVGLIASTGAWNIGPTNGTGNLTLEGKLFVKYNGTQNLLVDQLGDAYIGNSASNSLRAYGTSLLFNNAGTAAQANYIASNATDGSLAIGGSNTLPSFAGAGIIAYGDTHATKANKLEIYTNNTLRGLWSSAGSLVTGTGALATNATDGFLYVPTSAGLPTGTPTTQTGTSAIEVDTTNNGLMFYNSGWKSAGARQVATGTAVTSNSSALNSTTFAAFDVTPSVTFTPARSGTWYIFTQYAYFLSGTGGHGYNLKVANTVGSASITFNGEQYSDIVNTGRNYWGSAYCIASLTAGVSYTFQLQAKVTSGDTITLGSGGPTNGVNMIAWELG